MQFTVGDAMDACLGDHPWYGRKEEVKESEDCSCKKCPCCGKPTRENAEPGDK